MELPLLLVGGDVRRLMGVPQISHASSESVDLSGLLVFIRVCFEDLVGLLCLGVSRPCSRQNELSLEMLLGLSLRIAEVVLLRAWPGRPVLEFMVAGRFCRVLPGRVDEPEP